MADRKLYVCASRRGRPSMRSTYLRVSPRSFFEIGKVWGLRKSVYSSAERKVRRVALAVKQIEDRYGVTWKGKRLLDVGCGQLLAYTLAFARDNKVTGIDIELPIHRPLLPVVWQTMRRSGLQRTAKSLVAFLLGRPRVFETGLRHAMGFQGTFDYDLQYMDAMNLAFPDQSFDGAYSFGVFEHIPDPQRALREVHRVLKPGGVCYLDIHLYTGVHGDHDPRGLRGKSTWPPWNHLRSNGRWRETCYLNKIRLREWRRLIAEVFPSVYFAKVPGEADRVRRYLTPEISAALSDYAEEELLTTTFIAVAAR